MKSQIKLGIPSGFKELDCITEGWQPGNLIIIAARPSMGKTAFVTSMARNMVIEHENKGVAFFSLEMSEQQLVRRLERIEPDVKLDELLYIDTTPALSISEFEDKCTKLALQNRLSVAIVDYLQLMTLSDANKRSREQEVSSIIRSLKTVARKLNITVIVLSQLNRGDGTHLPNKRPLLATLPVSDSIEQDADIVAFIHRPEYYGFHGDEEGNSLDGVADIIIAKNRNGAAADIRLKFIKDCPKFVECNQNTAVC